MVGRVPVRMLRLAPTPWSPLLMLMAMLLMMMTRRVLRRAHPPRAHQRQSYGGCPCWLATPRYRRQHQPSPRAMARVQRRHLPPHNLTASASRVLPERRRRHTRHA